eukprot:7937061-Ditylum_brightwellii.AAC.1
MVKGDLLAQEYSWKIMFSGIAPESYDQRKLSDPFLEGLQLHVPIVGVADHEVFKMEHTGALSAAGCTVFFLGLLLLIISTRSMYSRYIDLEMDP